MYFALYGGKALRNVVLRKHCVINIVDWYKKNTYSIVEPWMYMYTAVIDRLHWFTVQLHYYTIRYYTIFVITWSHYGSRAQS